MANNLPSLYVIADEYMQAVAQLVAGVHLERGQRLEIKSPMPAIPETTLYLATAREEKALEELRDALPRVA